MDEVTQQNSALVEENAAAAKTLEQQAGAMAERVGFFRIDEAAAPRRAACAAGPGRAEGATVAPVAGAGGCAEASAGGAEAGCGQRQGRRPVGRMQSALATALKDDPEWKEF